jgi:hypothetical protein
MLTHAGPNLARAGLILVPQWAKKAHVGANLCLQAPQFLRVLKSIFDSIEANMSHAGTAIATR